jgi:hypothetical protein
VLQGALHYRRWEVEGGSGLADGEGRVGAGVAADDVSQRIGHRFQQGRRQPGWRRDAESIPEPSEVLGHRPTALPAHVKGVEPSGGCQLRQGVSDLHAARAPPDLLVGEGPQLAEHVDHFVR